MNNLWLDNMNLSKKFLVSHTGVILVFGAAVLIINLIFPSLSVPIIILFAYLLSQLTAAFFIRSLSRSIGYRLGILNNKVRLFSEGYFIHPKDEPFLEIIERQDELGQLTKGIFRLSKYLENVQEGTILAIKGDFEKIGQPLSEQDQFGLALKQFFDRVEQTKTVINQSIGQIRMSSNELSNVYHASTVILQDVNQRVNRGLTEKMGGTGKFSDAEKIVKNIKSSIRQNISELQLQKKTIDWGSEISSKFIGTIKHVAEDIDAAANESTSATKIVQTGVEKIGTTFKNIEGIRSLVELSQEKVTAMQSQTGKISRIVETIEDIAAQTNLLAINATIEAAHAESDSKVMTEAMLERFMLAACELITSLLESSDDIPPDYWFNLGDMAGIDQILITDDDGVIVIGNDPGLLGFRFPEDNPQTAEFRTLISQKSGQVCQPAQMRAADKQVYKYAGVSRRDQPGIVQVGYNMNSLALFNFQIGGFAVVAREVYDLAESSRNATKEIRQLLKGIQDAANEANRVMENSVGSVKSSLSEAVNAGNNLNEIMQAINHVSEKTNAVAGITQKMQGVSSEFEHFIEDIQQRLVENTNIMARLDQDVEGIKNYIDTNNNFSREIGSTFELINSTVQELKIKLHVISENSQKLQQTISALETKNKVLF